MLYDLLYPLRDIFGGFNVIRYITFRTIWAAITALSITLILGPYVIRWLRKMQLGQYIRELGRKAINPRRAPPPWAGC